jgi:hypothetical protein
MKAIKTKLSEVKLNPNNPRLISYIGGNYVYLYYGKTN